MKRNYFLFMVLLFSAVIIKAEVNENRTFSSYNQATQFYYNNFTYDRMIPDSTSIAKADYFSLSKRKVLIVFFTSSPYKPYIHEGISLNTWNNFKSASSKGKYYHAYIKGQYNFRLY